jgi:hypothetical protein
MTAPKTTNRQRAHRLTPTERVRVRANIARLLGAAMPVSRCIDAVVASTGFARSTARRLVYETKAELREATEVEPGDALAAAIACYSSIIVSPESRAADVVAARRELDRLYGLGPSLVQVAAAVRTEANIHVDHGPLTIETGNESLIALAESVQRRIGAA